MKKIIFIFNQFAVSPDMPGGTRHFDFALEFIKKNYDVYIFASDYSLHELKFKKLKDQSYLIEDIDNVKFVWIKTFAYKKNNYKRVFNQIFFAINAFIIAKKMKKPDYIIGSSPQLFTAFSALLLSIKYRIKFISEIRDIWPASLIELKPIMKFHPYTMLLSLLEKIIYRKSKNIIVFTDGNKEMLKGKGYKNVDFIPNGINTNVKSDIKYSQYFKKFLNDNIFKIVYTGSIGIANNIKMILDVAEKIDKDIEFFIVGDGPLKKDIVEEIKQRKIHNVKIVNPIPKKHVFDFLYNMDVCFITLKDVFLFKYGVSPNKLFDYMYAKKPIICAVGGWSNKIVNEAQCGIAVEPENVNQFVNAVKNLYLMNIEKRNKMGENGYKYVVENFSRNILIEKFEKILRS